MFQSAGLLAGKRYHEIRTRTRLTLAVAFISAVSFQLVGVWDLGRSLMNKLMLAIDSDHIVFCRADATMECAIRCVGAYGVRD